MELRSIISSLSANCTILQPEEEISAADSGDSDDMLLELYKENINTEALFRYDDEFKNGRCCYRNPFLPAILLLL